MGQLASLPWQDPHPQPLTVAPSALAREDHPDLIQNAKKSGHPREAQNPPAAVVHPPKKVYLKVRPDVKCPAKGVGRRGGGKGEPRQVGRAWCRAGEEAPPQGWAAWTGPGPAGVCACVRGRV